MALLCEYEYSRSTYCVIMHDTVLGTADGPILVPSHAYVSLGKVKETPTDTLEEVSAIISNNFALHDDVRTMINEDVDCSIEDDDSILQLLQKLECLTLMRRDFLYLYCGSAPDEKGDEFGAPVEPRNMCFDWAYSIDHNNVRKFNYSAIPSLELGEQINSEAMFIKHARKEDFLSSIMSKFDYQPYYRNWRIIRCVPFTGYFKIMQQILGQPNNLLLRTYYPYITKNLEAYNSALTEDPDSFVADQHDTDSEDIHKLKTHINGVRTAILAVNDQLVPDLYGQGHFTIGPCRISEAVIRVNYGLANLPFVDLGKVFNMYRVNENVPFARFKSAKDKDAKFKIFRGLTDSTSDMYIAKDDLYDWTDVKVKRRGIVNATTYAQIYTRNATSARGLSFKVLNYITEDSNGKKIREYATVNIYHDGKIEIKCSWNEKVEGTAEALVGIITKIVAFIEEINRLQFYLPGAIVRRIDPPQENFLEPGYKGNTKVAFFNALFVTDFKYKIDYDEFWKTMEAFAHSYIIRIKDHIRTGQDKRAINLRYRRVHDFIHMDRLDSFIKTYKDVYPVTGELNAYNNGLAHELATHFNILKTDGLDIIAAYNIKHENKQGRGRELDKEEKDRKVRRVNLKVPGIQISISGIGAPASTDWRYKVTMLGIKLDQLGPVYNFMKALLVYHQYRGGLGQLQPPHHINYLMGHQEPEQLVDDNEGQYDKKIMEAQTIHNKMKQEAAAREAQRRAEGTVHDTRGDMFDLGSDDEDDASENTSGADGTGSTDDGSEDGDASGTTKAKPQPLPPSDRKRYARHPSLIDILKKKDKLYDKLDRGTDGKTGGEGVYSRKCQASAGRQPLAINPATKELMLNYIEQRREEIESELAAGGLAEDQQEDKRRHLGELAIHEKSLLEGEEYRGNFLFCPLTWDHYNDEAGYDVNLPRFSEAESDERYYASKTKAWIGAYSSDPDSALMSGTPAHPYLLGFVQDLGNPEEGTCLACCFKTMQAKAKQRKQDCLLAEQKVGTSTADTSYILAQNKAITDERRLGKIPDKLNHIFNHNDDGLKLHGGRISAGFDYYLRRGVTASGSNYFLNAIRQLNPNVKNIIEHLATYLRDVDTDMRVFRSLKRGAIFQIFMPGSDEPEEARLALQDSTISRDRFIAYMQEKQADINEDFLWDLLTHPGVITLPGFNLVICEILLQKRGSNAVDKGNIKCPVGFEHSELYNEGRSTLVLYKYSNRYEVICHAVANEHKQIVTDNLFEPGNPLIAEILRHIHDKCIVVPNKTALQELRNHIRNVSKPTNFDNAMLNTSLEQFDLNRVLYLIGNFEYKVAGDPELDFDVKYQLIDSYTKVTYLLLNNGIWLPVRPSGMITTGGLEVMPWTEAPKANYRDTVKALLLLVNLGNFEGYEPTAFLLDPGENLDDPEDDIIIGLVLQNGLIIYTSGPDGEPEMVRDLTEDNSKLSIKHSDKTNGAADADPEGEADDAIEFDLKKLLLAESERQEVWFDDYMRADEELMRAKRDTHDLRLVYASRSDFEHESYQKFRYEFSKILSRPENEEYKATIEAELQRIESADQQTKSSLELSKALSSEVRSSISSLVYQLMEDHVTTEPNEEHLDRLLQAIGPLTMGYDDLAQDDALVTGYKYDYVRPNIRYSCTDPTLAEYRVGDIHCVREAPVEDNEQQAQDKLFLPPVNLINGLDNNFGNYVERLTEELVRIPLKRGEILTDQVDNFVSDIHVLMNDEYYMDSPDLIEDIRKVYEKGVDYQRRMREHYDVLNPEGVAKGSYTRDSTSYKTYYINLPKYWIKQLGTLTWKIVQLENYPNAIYKTIGDAISQLDQYATETVECRIKIAELIENSQMDDFGLTQVEGDRRDGWQLVRDYYYYMWRTDYRNVRTKDELLNMIRHSPRHHISIMDLSLISRAYNVKFIIISKPTERNQSGVMCMGTTQAEGGAYILLYHQGLDNYNVIVSKAIDPPKMIFTEAELVDLGAKPIFDVWMSACGDDRKEELDPANFLFRDAPIVSKNAVTGRDTFIDKDGNVKVPHIPRRRVVPKTPDTGAPEPLPFSPVPIVGHVPGSEPPTMTSTAPTTGVFRPPLRRRVPNASAQTQETSPLRPRPRAEVPPLVPTESGPSGPTVERVPAPKKTRNVPKVRPEMRAPFRRATDTASQPKRKLPTLRVKPVAPDTPVSADAPTDTPEDARSVTTVAQAPRPRRLPTLRNPPRQQQRLPTIPQQPQYTEAPEPSEQTEPSEQPILRPRRTMPTLRRNLQE